MKLGLSHQRPESLTSGRLAYMRNCGVEALEIRIPTVESSLSRLMEIKSRVEDAGLALHEIMLTDRYSCEAIALGGPESEVETEAFCGFLERLGKAGITATTYAWHTGGCYETGRGETRGCATRRFELARALRVPNAGERTYTEKELWDNYERFIRRVLPVAVNAGVRLQLHPNDPPVDHAGVPRIFKSTAAYRRATTLSGHSPYAGILFCVGTWAEMPGPDGSGEDVVAAVREFGSLGLIHQVHLRNIDSPLPDFIETLPDNGYLDLPVVVRTLAETGFDGMIVPDHVPVPTAGDADRMTMEAFSLGYTRAAIQAAGEAHRRDG